MIKAFGIDFGKIDVNIVAKIMRIMALPSLLVVILVGYDILGPAAKEVKGVAISRYENPKDNFGVRVNYHSDYADEEVDRRFYDVVQKNDELVIEKSKIFGFWKEVEIRRNQQVVGKFYNMGRTAMFYIGLIFLLPILSFTPLPKQQPFVLGVFIFIPEILAVIFCIRIAAVLLGIIPHF